MGAGGWSCAGEDDDESLVTLTDAAENARAGRTRW